MTMQSQLSDISLIKGISNEKDHMVHDSCSKMQLCRIFSDGGCKKNDDEEFNIEGQGPCMVLDTPMPKHKKKIMIPFVGRGNFINYPSPITPRTFKKPSPRNLELEPILENFESEVGSIDAGILKNYHRGYSGITYQLKMLKDEGDLNMKENTSKEFPGEDKGRIPPRDSDGKSNKSPRFGRGGKFFVPKN
jgi:hypothetical protein